MALQLQCSGELEVADGDAKLPNGHIFHFASGKLNTFTN